MGDLTKTSSDWRLSLEELSSVVPISHGACIVPCAEK